MPSLRHRWNEAHEVLHDIIPWHEGATFGDNNVTLTPACHEVIEAEANYGAGRLLFLQDRFTSNARALSMCMNSVHRLKKPFGNTLTSTLWRCVEVWGRECPVVGMITIHPKRRFVGIDFDPLNPCKHVIQSELFAKRFSSVSEINLFKEIEGCCSARGAGPLGSDEIQIADDAGVNWLFVFETFYNSYEALTLAMCADQVPTQHFISSSTAR